jgi:DUF4097 and DUF4098 domain-containing protein YvlB
VWLDRVDLDLPLHTALELGTGAGSVEVSGLDGFVAVDTSSGSMRVVGAGEVRLHAGSGSIDVSAVRGELVAESGSIRMQLAGDVVASAGSGSIAGSFGAGGRLETRSGSIDVELVTPLERDLDLRAGSGSITLTVPAGVGFQLEAQVGSGSVHVAVQGAPHDGSDYTGEVAGGGPFRVHVETESGSIHIVERSGT